MVVIDPLSMKPLMHNSDSEEDKGVDDFGFVKTNMGEIGKFGNRI